METQQWRRVSNSSWQTVPCTWCCYGKRTTNDFLYLFSYIVALKFCFKTCVTMKFVDDDDDDDDDDDILLCCIILNCRQAFSSWDLSLTYDTVHKVLVSASLSPQFDRNYFMACADRSVLSAFHSSMSEVSAGSLHSSIIFVG